MSVVGSACMTEVSSLPLGCNCPSLTRESIFHMVKSKDKKKLQDTINNSVKIDINYRNDVDETPLMVACKHKRWVNAFIILDRFGEEALPGLINCHGISVLYYAYINDNLLNRLLTYKSVLQIITNVFPNGETLLTSLIINGNVTQSLNIINNTNNNFHNYRNNSGNSSLILACINRQFRIASALINAGANSFYYNNEGINALMYLHEDENKTDELLILYFHIIEKSKTQIHIQDFMQYSSDMFTEIIDISIPGGTYGNIKYAYDSLSDRSYILKQYKNTNSYKILTDDLIKEIVFIKDLSSKCESIVNIYGIYVDEMDNFYVVFEPLSVTVDEYIEMSLLFTDTLDNNRIREKKINYIYNTVINTMNKIHSNGIIHNDMKFQNILFNYNGEVKVIDFGIADYTGISPYKNVIQNYMSSSHIRAPDYGDVIKINILSELEDGKYHIKTYKFGSCRKSYLSDVFSVGVSFIQALLRRSSNKFISIDGTLYKEMKSDSLPVNDINLLILGKKSESILKSYSFYDNLVKMVNIDANKRLKKTNKNKNPSTYIPCENKYISRNVHYSTEEIRKVEYELMYADQIYMNLKKTVLSLEKGNNIEYIKETINRIIAICNNKISIDTYYNMLYYSLNYKGVQDIRIAVISYFYIFSYIFQWYPIDIELFVTEFDIPKSLLVSFVNSFILSSIASVSIIPFVSLIERMVILLQINGNDSRDISLLEELILNNLFIKLTTSSDKFILWDYIQRISFDNIPNFPYNPIYQEI